MKDQILAAYQRIASYVRQTPVEYSAELGAFLKLEHLQHTGSFKFRGASNKIALLTPEQKDAVAAIGLPFGRGGGGGGPGGPRGASGRPGAGGPPGAGGGPPGAGGPPPAGMMMGMGGGNPDENPFSQEANQKRLRDLLARISPASAESGDKSP